MACFSVKILLSQTRYWPGDIVRGTVLLHATRPFRVRMVFLQLVGEEKIEYEEDPGPAYNAEHQRKLVLNACNCLIDRKQMVFGSKTGEIAELDAGSHEFPVAFQLPDTLPPSFALAGVGHIRYQLRATVDSPGEDKEVVETFRMCTNYSLQPSTPQGNAVSPSKEHTFGSKDGSLTLRYSLPDILRLGDYDNPTIGVQMPSLPPSNEHNFLAISIMNHSSKKVKGIKLALHQKITIRTERIACALNKKVWRLRINGGEFPVQPKTTLSERIEFALPADIPPTILLGMSRFITVSYTLSVTAVNPFGTANLVHTTPVLVASALPPGDVIPPSTINVFPLVTHLSNSQITAKRNTEMQLYFEL